MYLPEKSFPFLSSASLTMRLDPNITRGTWPMKSVKISPYFSFILTKAGALFPV